MKRQIALGTFVLGVFASASVWAGEFVLHPNGFGPESYAAWKAKQGIPDDPEEEGRADMALYFQKQVSTSTNAAGIAVITGFLKAQPPIPVASLTGLSWEHRDDGHCGAGAPRWDIFVTGASGRRYTLFLGCAAAVHSPGSEPAHWIRDSYPVNDIVPLGAANAGLTASLADIQAGTIRGLQIVFDEGTDSSPPAGFVFLDNITVVLNGMPHVWRSPADNGNN
jgi:hypothetical protein